MSTHPLKTVIVDDQLAIRKDLESLLSAQPDFIIVGSCGSVKDARLLIELTKPELLLLDINLVDGTAFDLLQLAPPQEFGFKVIFLTAHEQHAIKAIKLGALDYLLKPLDVAEFRDALQKVAQSHPAHAEQLSIVNEYKNGAIPNRIVLRSQQFLQVVDLDTILYCKSDTGYTTFYLADGRKILTSRYIKEYEDILPASRFLRTHQSFLVNTLFIDRYHRDEGFIVLKDGTRIIVSDRRRDFVFKYLTAR